MKYCRFQSESGGCYGLIESYCGREVITPICDPFAREPARAQMVHLPFEEARLLAPVTPSKIVCVGRNYREHAKELGNEVPAELLIFLKPSSSVIGPGAEIRRPQVSKRVDYEGELGVVMGRECRGLRDSDDVRPYIRGYTCVNDVTARDLQNSDGQWTRAKGFDTFCPIGPVVSDELDPWAGVEVETRVNGQVRQQGNTRDFIFSLDAIIRYVSGVMTLVPGDVISTGTPAGVGPLQAGDVVEVSVQGVGTLRNPVAGR
jgi:2-keto-4-pentenoate hydratase/2-oxohepta-3-ene-1,7-dioic acid hydratase in catechol pathway